MKKAVIFDMDGVLIDSQLLHYLGDQMTLKLYGVDVQIEDMILYAGTTNKHRFSLFKECYHIQSDIEEMIRVREEIMIHLVKESDLIAVHGVEKLLINLKNNQVLTAVASSSSYPFINAVLEKIGLINYFDLIFSGEAVEFGKPAPDVFLETAKMLGVSPDDCLVVEDSSNGVLAAKRARMKCLGYINPTSGKQDLSLADIKTDNFSLITLDNLL